MRDFQGRTVFVTGANRGIGKAMVEAFANRGADIVAHSRKPGPEFEKDMAALAESGRVNVRTVYFDLADSECAKNETKKLLKEVTPDSLINNAGMIWGSKMFMSSPPKIIREIFNINVFAVMELTQLFLKSMIKKKKGAIINIASVAALNPKPGASVYGASKAALVAWTKSLASECGPLGIRANVIAPGMIETEGADLMGSEAKKRMLENCALHRLGEPSEVANLACFLASDDASFINGAVIHVDGGEI